MAAPMWVSLNCLFSSAARGCDSCRRRGQLAETCDDGREVVDCVTVTMRAAQLFPTTSLIRSGCLHLTPHETSDFVDFEFD